MTTRAQLFRLIAESSTLLADVITEHHYFDDVSEAQQVAMIECVHGLRRAARAGERLVALEPVDPVKPS